jgi:hypothetical protein
MERTVEDLRAELREAEAKEREEREARKAAVEPILRYTLTLDLRELRREPLWDPACRYYRLEGEVINEQELLEAGHSRDEARRRQGGMTYLFNSATGRFVKAVGGGNVYISAPHSSFNSGNPEVRATWSRLSEFIKAEPDGGDVTAIVRDHDARIKGIEADQASQR